MDAADLPPLAFEALAELPCVSGAPRLTQASCELLHERVIVDETGSRRRVRVPIERALAIFVDKEEVVTLMTLGARPELLVLGYLLNQRLVAGIADVESITVDWDCGAAAVCTRAGARPSTPAARVVTSGCGQGTVFGDQLEQLRGIRLPPPSQARLRQGTLMSMLETMRQRPSIHRAAGSVHGCALFAGERLLIVVEDVGRHNAVDTIAGWAALHGVAGADTVFYTTGRLTSEMVIKAALMGVPIVVSRNGVTAMGLQVAEQLGMTLFGRAAQHRFLCYVGSERLVRGGEVNE